MPIRTACLLFVLGLSACASPGPTAKTPPPSPTPLVAAGPWLPLQRFIMEHLDQSIARASGLTATEPWRFYLPLEDPALKRFAPYVRQVLRSRDVVPPDDSFKILRIGPLMLVGDTAEVSLAVGGMFRCPGETRERGWGSFETVRTVRDSVGTWSPAWSYRRGQGDSDPCPRAR